LEEDAMGPMSGRVAIITGAGSGIGAATAEAFGRLGMRLVLVGRRQQLIEDVADRLARDGAEALPIVADVRVFADQAAVVAATMERFGQVDVFVANAAVADFGPVHEADPEIFRDVITTNVLGVLYGARAVLPAMYARGSGHIVIVSSGSGRSTYVGEPAYVASKHATVAFADCLRIEVAPKGLRVTVLEPGLVETPLIHVWEGSDDLVVGVTPLSPADCARAIVFAVEQPPSVTVFEIAIRPTSQI
jgi:NADP-dependent 3-hydroxy acid dehydrogenase YdfG